jgi:hypothetical protein
VRRSLYLVVAGCTMLCDCCIQPSHTGSRMCVWERYHGLTWPAPQWQATAHTYRPLAQASGRWGVLWK